MGKQKTFILTADDYALTPGVTRGILALIEAGTLSATGAMTNRPHWREAARALAGLRGQADVGLHLNLTCGSPLTPMRRLCPGGEFPKLPRLLTLGPAGLLPLGEIAEEFRAQIQAFEDATGMAPDFIDGHQHVHALPGVRQALATALREAFPLTKPYLRDPADTIEAIHARGRQRQKAMLLAFLARPFAPRMKAIGFAMNAGFAGFSAFDSHADYAADFASYLVAPGTAHLVMCHPGEVDDELRRLDPAVESRASERAFFLSPRFRDLCDEASLKPARMSAVLEP
jgi:hypothetical protein